MSVKSLKLHVQNDQSLACLSSGTYAMQGTGQDFLWVKFTPVQRQHEYINHLKTVKTIMS